MNLQIKRSSATDQGTFGVMSYEGKFICYTGELPWRDNKPQISCIPPGAYTVEPWNSRKFPNTYHLKDVQGRSAILTHQGNLCGDKSKGWLSHVLGCIAVGDKRGTIRGQQAVLLSVVAMRHLRELIGRKSFGLDIVGAGA
jgi:hypothetical protein